MYIYIYIYTHITHLFISLYDTIYLGLVRVVCMKHVCNSFLSMSCIDYCHVLLHVTMYIQYIAAESIPSMYIYLPFIDDDT